VYLAAIGPKNLELTGQIADGWLAIFFSPEHAAESLAHVEHGRSAAGLTMDGFDVVPTVPLVIGDDLEACAAPVRAYSALYLGGMGSRTQNFYNRLAVRMGYAQAAEVVQALFLDRKHREAAEAVPFEFVDKTALIGPFERVRDRLQAYAESGVTTLSVAVHQGGVEERVGELRALVAAVEAAGLAGGSP
jgi:alkanesulfonate monooxygenase SsuD/methylene tetrahydromethanopterin reductase-like flavin-dependent oxidoreductase (luciferase family)